MKLGDLVDHIRRLEEAEERVRCHQVSLSHGGSPDTMRNKRESLEDAEYDVRRIRAQEVGGE